MRVSQSINDRGQLGKKWESAGRIGRMKEKKVILVGVNSISGSIVYVIYIPLESPQLYLTILILPYSPREIVRLAHGPYM